MVLDCSISIELWRKQWGSWGGALRAGSRCLALSLAILLLSSLDNNCLGHSDHGSLDSKCCIRRKTIHCTSKGDSIKEAKRTINWTVSLRGRKSCVLLHDGLKWSTSLRKITTNFSASHVLSWGILFDMGFSDGEQIVPVDNGGVSVHSSGFTYHIRTSAWVFQFYRLPAWSNNCLKLDEWNIRLRYL